jgi:hypothetical protein
MMIDIAEEEYKIDIRKNSTRTIDHFKHKEQQTIMFACNLFWGRQIVIIEESKETAKAKGVNADK